MLKLVDLLFVPYHKTFVHAASVRTLLFSASDGVCPIVIGLLSTESDPAGDYSEGDTACAGFPQYPRQFVGGRSGRHNIIYYHNVLPGDSFAMR